MNIEINGKEYALYFGWDFLEQINKTMGAEVSVGGESINTRTGGMSFLEAGLGQYDPIALEKALKAGMSTLRSKPSNADVRKHIETLIVEDMESYKEFVDEVAETIKKEPMLKALANMEM